MQITKKKAPSGNHNAFNNISINVILFSFFLVIGCVSVVVYKTTVEYFPTGIKQWIITEAEEYGFRQMNDKTGFFEALRRIPQNISSEKSLQRIFLDIKFKHLEKLRAKRDKALQLGILEKSGDDFVPAEIRTGDRTIKTKLRLKGDWTDHLEGKKWSFRVHVKGKDHLFGMRRFSIQHPKTRGFQSEILFLETLKKYGVLTPRYMFVNVTVNGDDIGVMALEEHFSKELLEHCGRKEGVIIRYDESLVWKATDGATRGFGGAFDDYTNARIDAFRSKKIRKSMRLNLEHDTAVGLLRSFSSRDLTASEVFDPQQLAGFLAVSEFFRASHAIRWHNLRFYLNPFTMKLEPIGFDADVNHPSLYPMPLSDKEPIAERMLSDPKIRKLYLAAVDTIINDFKSGNLVGFLKEKEKEALSQLHNEFFLLGAFDYDRLNLYEKMITSGYRYPKIKSKKYPVFIHAFLINDNGNKYVEVFNALPLPINISSIRWKDKSGGYIDFQSDTNLLFPILLAPNEFNRYTPPLHLPYHMYPETGKAALEIISHIRGSEDTRKTVAQAYIPAVTSPPLPPAAIAALLEQHPFLSVTGNNTVSVKKGEWAVNTPIVIPENYSLFIPAGTILRFSQDSCIISHGPLNFAGTKSEPIILTGKLLGASDETGKWQGVVVLQSSYRSTLTHTHIANTTGIKQNKWNITAGTTFYMSDVTINSCIFENNTCEDALNTVHSDFSFNNIAVKNCFSDAFDSDFCTGKIMRGLFQDVGLLGGGDGVDTSGSSVRLKDSRFVRVNDKAISIGEKSNFKGENITIEDSGTGIVSKDASAVDVNDVVIKNCRNASLMAYIKKPEYGPSELIGNNIVISGNAKKAIVQDESKIVLNGKTVEPEALNVENLYDTVMKPGLKK